MLFIDLLLASISSQVRSLSLTLLYIHFNHCITVYEASTIRITAIVFFIIQTRYKILDIDFSMSYTLETSFTITIISHKTNTHNSITNQIIHIFATVFFILQVTINKYTNNIVFSFSIASVFYFFYYFLGYRAWLYWWFCVSFFLNTSLINNRSISPFFAQISFAISFFGTPYSSTRDLIMSDILKAIWDHFALLIRIVSIILSASLILITTTGTCQSVIALTSLSILHRLYL